MGNQTLLFDEISDCTMSTTNDYRIGIIGPADTVSGFKALGVDVFAATTAAEALAQLRQLKQIGRDSVDEAPYAIVCVIEEILRGVDQAEYAKVVSGALPAVVVLPGPEGSHGVALARLRRLAEQAVGSAII